MKTRMALVRRQKGFAFLEVMMATAISSLILGALVVTIYQFNKLTCLHHDLLTQSQQLQQVATVLNHDIVSAKSGQVSAQRLILEIPTVTFGDEDSLSMKTIAYTLNDDGTLTRNEDGGGALTVARYVDSVSFSPTGPISSTGTVEVTIVTEIRGKKNGTKFTLSRRPSD